jgi:hypothetical protein
VGRVSRPIRGHFVTPPPIFDACPGHSCPPGRTKVPVANRTAPPRKLSEAEQEERKAKAEALAPQYRTQLLQS